MVIHMSTKKHQITPGADIAKTKVEIKLIVNGKEQGTLDMRKPSASPVYRNELVWFQSGFIAPWQINCTLTTDFKADLQDEK